MSGVYAIVHTNSNRLYIGSSGNMVKRWTQHKSHLRHQHHSSQKLQRAWDKYGEDSFKFIVIEECNISELRTREQYWMDVFNSYENGFNGTKKALEHSEEVRARLSEMGKGRTLTAETKKKMSDSHKNNGVAPSVTQMHTSKARVKAAKAKLGRKHTDEAKAQMSKSRKGRGLGLTHTMSEESKKKLSLAKTGIKKSEEAKVEMRKPKSEEAKKNMSISAKLRAARPECRAQLVKNGITTTSKRKNSHE
jgi:group I intron endonuclease